VSIVVDLLKKNSKISEKSRQINPKQGFDISIFSVKMDDFHRKSNIPESYSMYKTLSGTSPRYLKIQFPFTSDIHSRTLRSSHETQLYMPKPRIELLRNTFVFSGSSIWNIIPDFIRISSNLIAYLRSDL